MDETTVTRTARPAHGSTRLPWPALVTMSLTVFVVVSGEMMPTAVLPALAADLGVSLARAGLLVSAWAATVVVASFPLTRLTARHDRATVVAGALTVVAIATVVTAAADSYGAALGSRLVAAAATGVLWSTVNAHAASIVPERAIARATSVVLFGGTFGTVAAIPAGNAIAAAVGWRVPFLLVAGLALATAVAVVVVLPRYPVLTHDDAAGSAARAPSRPLWPVLATASLGGVVFIAHFMSFTFVAELFAPSRVPTPVLLLVFGVVGAGGVVLVGASSDRYPAAVPVAISVGMAASLVSLVGLGRNAALDVTVVVAWGTVVGAVGPAVQAQVMRLAGTRHRATAGALMPVAMNLGIAVGAAAGSGAVDRWSPAALPLLSLLPAVLAVAGFLVVAGAQRSVLTTPGARG
ncbi:MFS transporter [Georgenia sp. H159]|uniref:MFS transporter n=1 Tax=Georgenia sp. H159 TaxID=3076115 RepID=UPI002D77BAC4|nr:MFS transporter [Georgenia sp. H159]